MYTLKPYSATSQKNSGDKNEDPMTASTSPKPSSSFIASAQGRSEQSEQSCATITSNVDDRPRIQRSSHESSTYQERTKVICCKMPSELRSRRTLKGAVMKLNELDEEAVIDESSPQTLIARPSLDDELACYEEASLQIRQDGILGTSPMDVPLLSLVVNKRRGKAKALMDEYDTVSKPGSRAVIVLDDEDQEFHDSWVPDFYVEEVEENRYPLYSDIVRIGLDRDAGGLR